MNRLREWLADKLEDWARRVRPEQEPYSIERAIELQRVHNEILGEILFVERR